MKYLHIILLGLTANVLAAAPVATAVDQKPAWLTEASLGLKEGFDDNVFASGVEAKYLPPSYTPPAGSAVALKDRSSWVTTVSPKVAVSFVPLLGDQKTFQTLSLAYAPDFAVYRDLPSESYDAHRIVTAIKGRAGAFSFAADNTFAFINGSSMGVYYPGALLNVYAYSPVRERREQMQDRTSVVFQYDWRKWFVRPVAALTYYDLMTEHLNVPGYQNYVDRYDVNGGADVGYKISPQLALTLGYRYGHQYQQQFDFSAYNASGDYQRVLLGIEGKPWKWLDVKIQFGPDFRDYPDDTATTITPVNDHHPVKYYGEAVLAATITDADTLTFKYKQWQWVASTGKVPYLDSSFDLGYHHQFSDALGFDLDGKILSADYSTGNLTACRRNDWEYVVTTGLVYAINRHFSVNLAYTLDLGRNAMDGIVDESTREFSQNIVSLGALVKF
jgi:hypothetical protein